MYITKSYGIIALHTNPLMKEYMMKKLTQRQFEHRVKNPNFIQKSSLEELTHFLSLQLTDEQKDEIEICIMFKSMSDEKFFNLCFNEAAFESREALKKYCTEA